MQTNMTLEAAPYSLTLTKDDELYNTSVYADENAATVAAHAVLTALGVDHKMGELDCGVVHHGSFSLYITANGDTDDIISVVCENIA